ncbi:putative membrane protein [Luteibacter sp. Sphag1AF]|uniref:sensor domain-containing protein n=1 Tax=Luteibacter sp. Sphag1AF TaxID=2587031 RepID=UPI0016187767|nr:sensor domain-containing protein [Luteibacter sp. Sphag1AF]MBB3227240.1 putative membrane protein [Luteibacter sp. Sphag1AF]
MSTPRTIAQYLDQLRDALRGQDPALIQDALYDAEEHLRAELAENPDRSEADMLDHVVNSYGNPEEVAEIYRGREVTVQRALRPPKPPARRSLWGAFFGVAMDSRTYGSLFYMLLALVTGIFYFTWAVVGISLSAGLAVLIIGIPFVILFIGTVRALSLVEGRIVESMLGVRMPRRPPYPAREGTLWSRIGAMFVDARTWGSLLYMLAMLPLGIIYFTLTITFIAVSIAFTLAPVARAADSMDIFFHGNVHVDVNWPGAIALGFAGVILLFATLHMVRGLGQVHGQIARHFLVKS